MDADRTRRTLLVSTATACTGLAGCLGGSSSADGNGDPSAENDTASNGTVDGNADGGNSSDGNTSDGTSESEADAANYGIDHPSAIGAENDPRLGPPPTEAEMGIILFSEPSCPYCRDFHEEVYDQMKEELIDTGRLSYIYRPYPKVDEWATPASYGLLATWERDESAFPQFKRYYYDNPGEARAGTAEKTATFLNENTDVDGDAVAEAMNQLEQVSNLSESMDAAKEAGMTTIPSYTILRGTAVVTTATGSQSYANIKRMLGAD